MPKGELAQLRQLFNEKQQAFQVVPLLEQLGKFLEACATGTGPVMTSMMIDFGDGDQRKLLKLWATASMNSPMDRISQLLDRVSELEAELATLRPKPDGIAQDSKTQKST